MADVTNALDFSTYQQLLALYTRYAAAVDNAEWDQWTDLFVDDCTYKVQPRENHERGFPLAAGGICMTLRDLARFGMAFTKHPPSLEQGIIPDRIVNRFFNSRVGALTKRGCCR